METKHFESEWLFLQNQLESYEKHALYIKLTSILTLVFAEISGVTNLTILILFFIFWGQDAIWKTFQSRLEPRLLKLEKYIKEDADGGEFQFNSDYQAVRLSGLGLIKEYACQAIRPTIAFPHAALIGVIAVQCLAG